MARRQHRTAAWGWSLSTPAALNDRASATIGNRCLRSPTWRGTAGRARHALLLWQLSADAEMDVETTKTLLLSDIRDIFAASALDAMPSKNLVAALHDDPTKPWLAYGKNQKPITERQVSDLLKDFKVYPRTSRRAARCSRATCCHRLRRPSRATFRPLVGLLPLPRYFQQ